MSSMFVWEDIYLTGHPKVDEQHKKLVELVNTFYELKQKKLEKNQILKVFQELATYTVNHFNDEEMLIKETGEENFKAHKIIHEKLILDVSELKIQIQVADDKSLVPLFAKMCMFLCKWLSNHILEEDKKVIDQFLKLHKK